MEAKYGLFAYEEDLRNPEEVENPESEILGEENDLPAVWQVQFHVLDARSSEELSYESNEDRSYENTEQSTLETGVPPQTPNNKITSYDQATGSASD